MKHSDFTFNSNRLLYSVFAAFMAFSSAAFAENPEPVAWWDFESPENNLILDRASKIQDQLQGNFTLVDGIDGRAIRFDSFTTEITRQASEAPKLSGGFTIEGHVALGAYPWNWCPLVSQRMAYEAGYSMDIGTNGEVRFQLQVGDFWKVCTSPAQAIPLREWKHVAASYDPDSGIRLYVDGKQVSELSVQGEPTLFQDIDLKIGTGHNKDRPSDIHRSYGTKPIFFSLDGILDEIKIYDDALDAEQISSNYASQQVKSEPDLPQRRLPSGPSGKGQFGAYYEHLKYYPEWDALWPVAQDPDIVVRFDESPARMVFWRGTRYSPAWVSENDLWMADQSVEAWDEIAGCYEHMQDRRCRYSHVRIIESHDARAVVHWRYAPVSVEDKLWNEDEKTTRACWVDEYYYIYPDAAAVRNVSWKAGTLGHPQQFQESLPLTHPGQYPYEVVDPAWVSIANYEGETGILRFVENPSKEPRTDLPKSPTIQRYNFKSEQKPFICFEPGNDMKYLFDRNIRSIQRPGSCNHWPVGQAICDGRTSQAVDRPTHFCGFPISSPPKTQIGNRIHWFGLYGMTDKDMDHLVQLGRSWTSAAELEINGKGLIGGDYDRGQRAYMLQREPGEFNLSLTLHGTDARPILNPAFVIQDWGDGSVSVEIEGEIIPEGPDCRIGERRHLNGTDLIIWLKLDRKESTTIRLLPKP